MKPVLVTALGLILSTHAFALDVGDYAPCVVLDGQDSQGVATTGCIRDTEDSNHSYTLIEFFSIHCSTCQKNLPKVSQLANSIASTTTVRQIAVDRDVAAVKEYLLSAPVKGLVNFAVSFDPRQMAARAYGAFATPTLFVLDEDYEIVYKHQGELLEDDIEAIEELVEAF